MSLTPRLISRATFACSSRSLPRVLTCVPGPSRIPYQSPQPRSSLSSRYASTITPSSSASAPNLPPIPTDPKIRVTPPSLKDIKEEGFFEDDVALLPEQEARLVITPQAVQVGLVFVAEEGTCADDVATCIDYFEGTTRYDRQGKAGTAGRSGKWGMSWVSIYNGTYRGAWCG